MMRFVASLALLILSTATVARGQFGTKSLPAVSCQSLLSRGSKPGSGLYWIRPKGVADAFQGYCDMDNFGGGWLMCYTTNLHVHVSREVNSTALYATNGYRSDCRNFPFNHVMFAPCVGHQSCSLRSRFYLFPRLICLLSIVCLLLERRYVDHSAKISQHDRYTSVWFQFNGFGTIKASSTGYTGRLNSSNSRYDR
jgi:hypothetical protein